MAITMLALRIRFRRPSRAWWLTLAILLAMTAIFDSMIVGFGIVEYNPSKLLGLFVGKVPIEDFLYSILAVIIIPVLWNRMEKSI